MPMRRYAVLAVAGALVLSGCSSSTSDTGPSNAAGGTATSSDAATAKAGGTLRLGVSGTTGSVNLFSGLQGEYATFTAIYPTLVAYDVETQDFKPGFADTWDTSPDLTTWTFHTHPDAKWSDGEPLSARDAAFTLSTIVKFQQGPTASYAGYVSHLKTAEAPDDNTLVLQYEQPVGNVLAQAGAVQLLPEHVWGPFAQADGSALKSFPNTPTEGKPTVSGGPFMLTEQKTDDIELFARNPNYFGTKPLIDGFGVKFFSNNDAIVSALKNGDIDAIQDVPTTAVESLKSAGLVVTSQPGVGYSGLYINPTAQKTKNMELLDPKVREAFERAIDRDQVAQVVFLGHAQPGASVVPPALPKWNNPAVTPLPFDPGMANQLLDQAGFAKGGDGIRVANGHPMSYELLIQPTDDTEFRVLQAQFQAIGVKLNARALDPKAQFAAISANNYADYDLALGSGTTGGYDPDFGLSSFTCFALGQFNRSGYCDPAYDKLYMQQSTGTQSDRQPLVGQMQQMLFDARVPVVLAYPEHIDAWSKDWTGFKQTPEGIFSYLPADTLTGVHRAG